MCIYIVAVVGGRGGGFAEVLVPHRELKHTFLNTCFCGTVFAGRQLYFYC